jgi:hypothetical protein
VTKDVPAGAVVAGVPPEVDRLRMAPTNRAGSRADRQMT